MTDISYKITQMKSWLAAYDGPDISVMEVCGSHTAAISKYGISGLLSPKLHLISGPGCPVCVTPTGYIDRLIGLSMEADTTVVTFGDLIRVPGREKSLAEAKGEGASVVMVYSPMDILRLAKEKPAQHFVFAAVGFETTAPVYAMLMEQLVEEQIANVQLLTALKTMPPVIRWLCEHSGKIDGFLAPGHVAAVTGAELFIPLAKRYQMPFGVAGFGAEELLLAVYGTFRAVQQYRECGLAPTVKNYYPSVVTAQGNPCAKVLVEKYFEPCDALWRGIGVIEGSGRRLKSEYAGFDAGSELLMEDHKKNQACRCDQILMGRALPGDCPLFGTGCTPLHPQGACMVSEEGSCHQYLMFHRTR
ncbi:MAG: hydrogenase formation protein HypD [Lachnospiraceae bacterium]|nr:hydrogenase formation protein HypD [bacterium]MDY5516041.1 hydrogenase formation protein HypD [Lachnospiraceae bacterium]